MKLRIKVLRMESPTGVGPGAYAKSAAPINAQMLALAGNAVLWAISGRRDLHLEVRGHA